MTSPSTLKNPAGRLLVLAAFVLFGLMGGGCSSTPPKYVTMFYLEAPVGNGVEFTLPGSQLKMCTDWRSPLPTRRTSSTFRRGRWE